MCLGAAAVLLAEGRRRLPRWFFSHSTSRAMIQTRCRSPGRVRSTRCTGHVRPSATLWLHANSDIKLASAAFFHSPLVRWEKAPSDLTQCLKDKYREEEVFSAFENLGLSHLAVAQKPFLTKSIILTPAALTALWHWNVGGLSDF